MDSETREYLDGKFAKVHTRLAKHETMMLEHKLMLNKHDASDSMLEHKIDKVLEHLGIE